MTVLSLDETVSPERAKVLAQREEIRAHITSNAIRRSTRAGRGIPEVRFDPLREDIRHNALTAAARERNRDRDPSPGFEVSE